MSKSQSKPRFVKFHDQRMIRPSEIRAVWREACMAAKINLEECSWSILDAIYHGTPACEPEVNSVLKKSAGDVAYYLAKAGSKRTFDCDNAAFFLREKINKRAIRLQLATSFCFGAAVLRARTVELASREADVIGAPDEHVVNWLITADRDGALHLKIVSLSPGGPKARKFRVRLGSVRVEVAAPVLKLEDFIAEAGELYESARMILV